MRYNNLLLLLCILISTPYVKAESFTLDVGNTTINITSPDGFYKVKSSNQVASKLAKMVTAPSNKLLATLLTKDDIELSRSGEFPLASEYMLIQTPIKLLKYNLSVSKFKELKDLIKQQQHTFMSRHKKKMDAIVKGISSKFNNEYGEGYDMELSDSVSLGIFLDKSDAVGLTTVTTNNLVDLGTSYKVIGSSTTMLVNNKLLFIYVYKTVDNLSSDKLWVEAKTNEFVDLILEDNE
jgi:hypothetical protein